MKKIRVSLLTKVVIAIAAGVLFGQFLPGGIDTYLCNLQFIVRQLPIVLHPSNHIGAGELPLSEIWVKEPESYC